MSDTGKSSGLPVPMCNQTFPKAKFLTKLNGFWVFKLTTYIRSKTEDYELWKFWDPTAEIPGAGLHTSFV